MHDPDIGQHFRHAPIAPDFGKRSVPHVADIQESAENARPHVASRADGAFLMCPHRSLMVGTAPLLARTARVEVERHGDSWEKRTRNIDLVRSGTGNYMVQLRIRDQPVEVEFRDALGRRWKIDSDRHISKIRNGMRVKALPDLPRDDDDE